MWVRIPPSAPRFLVLRPASRLEVASCSAPSLCERRERPSRASPHRPHHRRSRALVARKEDDEFAGTSLRAAYEKVGLGPEYGGAHSNGATHMDLVGFLDGSYLELIGLVDPKSETPSPLWDWAIRADAGPCAWAIQVEDITGWVERLRGRGIAVDGPHSYHRERPDGRRVEWELAFPGNDPPGASLPFLIEDTTPRSLRVQPTKRVVELASANWAKSVRLEGVDRVVLRVNDVAGAVELFHTFLGANAATRRHDNDGLVELCGTPVLFEEHAVSRTLGGPANRPVAFLVTVDDLERAGRAFGLTPRRRWGGWDVAWLPPELISGTRLGLVETHPSDTT